MSGCGFCQSGKASSGHLSWKGFLSAIVIGLVATLVAVVPWVPVQAQEQTDSTCTSKEAVEKAKSAENKCLVIVEGYVYDVTLGKRWDLGGHSVEGGPFSCGQTYNVAEIEKGPHGRSVMDKFKLGPLCGAQPPTLLEQVEVPPQPAAPRPTAQLVSQLSYRFLGMSLFRLSAYLSLATFLLNFLTCYAMPWARIRQPWEGERPGDDPKDQAGHFPLTHWHKYFAWAAIFFLSLHGFLGFACAWWGKCF